MNRKPISRRRKVVLTVLGAALAAQGTLWGLNIARGADGTHTARYAPCAADDGPGPCLWLAYARGDGTGTSFVMDADGTVHPFGPSYGVSPAPVRAATTAGPARFAGTLEPCRSDDGPGPCWWDATRRGDRMGVSFVMDARGTVYPRHETRAEMSCKDVATEGAPSRIGPRFRACERTADRLARS